MLYIIILLHFSSIVKYFFFTHIYIGLKLARKNDIIEKILKITQPKTIFCIYTCERTIHITGRNQK
jgi:hypothetical protein